jgi:hypothetical protein
MGNNTQHETSKKAKPKLRVISTPKETQRPAKNEVEYFRALHLALDLIFEEAANSFKWTWEQLANHAGVCHLTVYNLGERQTRYPRYHTVYKLAKAVGWKLVVQAEKVEKKHSTAKVEAAAG